MKAIETTGTIEDQYHLHVDHPLPFQGPRRVKVIILAEEMNEIQEREWLKMAGQSPSFEFLKEACEEIYTLDDGKPYHDPR